MRVQLRASEHLANRVELAAAQAHYGAKSGFQALAASDAALAQLRKELLLVPARRSLSPLPLDLAPLLSAWRNTQVLIGRVRDTAPQVAALREDVERLQSVSTGLLVSSDELVDALISAQAQPSQLRAAARQLVLVQRIGTNVRRLLHPDAGLLEAADRLGRDAVVFGEVANALLHGNSALRITRVEEDTPRDMLTIVGREFRVLAQSVEAVMAGGAAFATLRVRAERLTAASLALGVHHASLRRSLAARSAQRLLQPSHALQLMGLSVVSVLAALVLGLSDRRRQGRSEAHWQAQYEISLFDSYEARDELSMQFEQLASDIHRIADGDLGLRAYSTPLVDRAAPAALGVARAGLDRLRQHLARQVEDGMRLAQSGQLVGDVAQRLRDSVRRHLQQAESTGQATRVMASALETLHQESSLVSEAARESGVSAQRASGALGETLHELDAVRAGVEECAARVRALEDAARELRAVRTLVEDVCELGKMLSLNVAIQASVDSAASRALTAFSDEVQRLSARARSAVTQVEAIHAELRSEAERAASAVKESVWRARSAAERARGARANVDDLAGSARRLDDLNHALARTQREHAVNVTEVVRAMTALHAITREVREHVDATADSALAFSDAAIGIEQRLAGALGRDESLIELAPATVDQDSGVSGDDGFDAPQLAMTPPKHSAVLEHISTRWR